MLYQYAEGSFHLLLVCLTPLYIGSAGEGHCEELQGDIFETFDRPLCPDFDE